MQIQTGELSDVSRYIESKKSLRLEDMQVEYDGLMRAVAQFKPITPATRMLEIGTGTGWFPLLCQRNGLQCKGLEISPQLIEYAREWGAQYNLVPDISLGNVEEEEIGVGEFDVIFANSVFEHIEKWRPALDRIYRSLAPGGAFLFISTNKFRFKSSEYDFPLYDWLPDQWRYKLRIARQGPDIMKLGIDFNQFTYPQLRRVFKEIGFSGVYDRVDIARADGPGLRHRVARLARANRLIRHANLTFCDATIFVCVK